MPERIVLSMGTFVSTDSEITLGGSLPFEIFTHYDPARQLDGALGSGRTSPLDVTIWRNDRNELVYRNEVGLRIHFDQPTPGPGLEETNSKYPELSLSAGRNRSLLLREGSITRHFDKGSDGIWRLTEIVGKNALKIHFHRNIEGHLERLVHPDGLVLEFANGRLGARQSIDLVGTKGERRVLVRYRYDDKNNLVAAERSYGSSRYYSYDANGFLVRWHDGRRTDYHLAYDAKRRVIAAGLVNDPPDVFVYDLEARRTTLLPGGDVGKRIESEFNASGKLIFRCDANGVVTTYEYNDSGQMLALRDGLGHATRYAYDSYGNVESIIDPEGRETFYSYDGQQNLTLVLDGESAAWRYDYDEEGNLVAIETPEGTRTEIVNDEAGLPVRIMRADGLMESRVYDAHHRLVAIRDYRGERTQFSYDAFGRITAVTNPLGGVTRLDYEDQRGLDFWTPSRVTRPDGIATINRYDAANGLAALTDGNGHTVRYRFGPHDRLEGLEDARGGLIAFGYDEAGRLLRVTNAQDRVWTFERDGGGRVIREEDFDGLAIEYSYDAADRLIESRHADGARLLYGYDASGLLTREEAYEPGKAPNKDEAGEVTRFWYDGRGLMARAENGAALVDYHRDRLGRVDAEAVNGRRVVSTYDCCGNRILRDIGGRLVKSFYDPMGGLARLEIVGTNPDNQHAPLLFRRDALGREMSRASGAGFSLEQRYDVIGQLVRQSAGVVPGITGGGLEAALAAERAARGPTAAPVMERLYGWDKAFAPTVIADAAWGKLDYTYDANGQITQTRFGDGAGERFRYDAALNTAGFGEGPSPAADSLGITPSIAGSGYDGAGQRRGIQGWLLSSGGRVKLATGPQGERIELEHDVRGRVVERRVERKGFRPKVWRYGWDAKDRLVRCLTPEGEAWRYGYDPFGRRVWKVREFSATEARQYAAHLGGTVDTAALAPISVTAAEAGRSRLDAARLEALGLAGIRTSGTGVGGGEGQPGLFGAPVVGVAFSWDGDVIAEEAPLRLDGSIDWNKAKRWHYEPNSFRPLAKEAPDGTLFYIVTDHLGTPREMFEENGKLRWAAEYRTWGEMRRLWVAGAANDNALEVDDPWADVLAPLERPMRSSNSGDDGVNPRGGGRNYGALALKDESDVVMEARFLCPIRFQGQWEDEETGLYYNRFRYYDPLAGQYMSPDPIGFRGGPRTHAYVVDPNLWVDPWGLAQTASSLGGCKELGDQAERIHNLAGSARAIANSAVAIFEGTNGQIYASGSGTYLNPAQRQALLDMGIPEGNIFSGAAFRAVDPLDNHAETSILRNLPDGVKVNKFGVSWGSQKRNLCCVTCAASLLPNLAK